MKIYFDKIVIFYKNGKIHHARVDTRKVFSDNRETSHSEYLYESEVNQEIAKIMSSFHVTDFHQLESMNIVRYTEYEKLSEEEKKNEENLHKTRKKEDFDNSRLAEIIDSADDIIARATVKLRKFKVKNLVIFATIIALIIGGAEYAIHTSIEPNHYQRIKAEHSVEQILADYKLSDGEINNLLDYLENLSGGDYMESSQIANMCYQIFDNYTTNSDVEKIVLSRFKSLGGLGRIRKMSGDELEQFCMYVVNLILGGDNYGNFSTSSDITAVNLFATSGQAHDKVVNALMDDYHVSRKRVEYSALPGESNAFYRLPAIIRYIILCQAEIAVEQSRFDFRYGEKPSWWANIHETYDYSKLLSEITAKKNECKEDVYLVYSSTGKTK